MSAEQEAEVKELREQCDNLMEGVNLMQQIINGKDEEIAGLKRELRFARDWILGLWTD